MINRTLPYFLEDRTGLHMDSDFDDIYDRLFLRVTRPSERTMSQNMDSTLMIYNVGRRSSLTRDVRSFQRDPSVILDFGPHGALGNISFVGSSISMPMNQYLKKTSMFSG